MEAGTIIYLVIISMCALVMIGIGIVQLKSKRPVGFWSGVKPPDAKRVKDVEAYNKKHGRMWILYGVGMPVSYLIVLPFGSELAAVLINCVEICGGIIAMMIYHNHLEKIYLKEESAD